MIIAERDAVQSLYSKGVTFDHYTQNMTDGHDRYKLATESISEYVEELNLDELRHPLRFLIIGQLDCTDCAVAIPAFATLADNIPEWEYRIVYKNEVQEKYDFKEVFGVGGKQTTPQILILDSDLRFITRWWDKSLSKKKLLKKYTALGLVGEERKKKISETPELNIRFEAKMVINEILSLVKKAVYYL